MTLQSRRAARAALLAGSAAAFVTAATLSGAFRLALLLDTDPSWALARLLLTLCLAAASAAAGAAAAALVFRAGREPAVGRDLEPIGLPRWALAATAALALLLGTGVRLAGLERLPFPLWHDEILVLPEALALEGGPKDFRDAVRTISDDGGNPSGTVGVLYLEGFRAVLRTFGTTVFGVRFLSAFGGVLSLVTSMLLGRALLPRGGGTLAGLVLAGLRWHLILSRWAWVLIVVVPILDVATLLAMRARRRVGIAAAAAGGAVAGIGTHVYLSAWIAAPALLLLLVWPAQLPSKRRFLPALGFAAAFAAAALPLFVLREGRRASYLVRAGNHNVAVEIGRTRSVLPLVRAARTALLAPWWLSDPNPGNDLPGRRRLPLPLAVALAVAFLRAGIRPRDDLSALLLAQAAMALLASLAWGERMSPNGSRFAYLTTVTAVAVAAGLMWGIGLLPGRLRRAGALLAIGGLFISGTRASGELLDWDRERPLYVGLVGQHTSVGWAAARWVRYGRVEVEPSPLYGPLTVETIRRHRILPRREAAAAPPSGPRDRAFRICPPGTPARQGERAVESVRDAWGKEWAVVYGRATGP